MTATTNATQEQATREKEPTICCDIMPCEVLKIFDEYFEEGALWFKHEECQYGIEFSGYTDGGGMQVHTGYICEEDINDVEAWYCMFDEIAEAFDPWEEAHLWLDEYGCVRPGKGVPFDNGLDLYHDYQSYKAETLEHVRDAIHEISLNQR